MGIRRVVTGHDASGKAVFASDGEVEPVTSAALPGSAFHLLWGFDEAPTFPDDGTPPPWSQYFPPVGGFRFGFFTLPPAGTAGPGPDVDLGAELAAFEAQMPGMLSHMEPEDPGMHTTDTCDVEVVISGQVVLELDDGEERLLGPGDTVVQNGTRHRWRNPGTEPAVLAVVLVGAHRSGG